jgi:hypothetical protein
MTPDFAAMRSNDHAERDHLFHLDSDAKVLREFTQQSAVFLRLINQLDRFG